MSPHLALPLLLLCVSCGMFFSSGAVAQVTATGKQLVMDESKGNCVACHQFPDDPAIASRATVGPALGAIKTRYPSRGKLAAVIRDQSASNPNTIMPPYGKHKILTEREIEAIVDYLWSSTRATDMATADAPPPVQINPATYATTLARGKQLWERKFKSGRSLASCFPNGARRVAATYPQFHSHSRQVITLELAINHCLKLHGEREIDPTDQTTLALLTAYARSLSDDQRTHVRVQTAGAKEKLAAGRKLFFARTGQQNQACASCHVQHAGSILRDRTLSAAIGQTAQWPRFDRGGVLTTLQMQYQRCLQRMGATPAALGSEDLNDLEFFHTHLSNGLPLKSLPVNSTDTR